MTVSSIVGASGSYLGARREKTDRTWVKNGSLYRVQNIKEFAQATRVGTTMNERGCLCMMGWRGFAYLEGTYRRRWERKRQSGKRLPDKCFSMRRSLLLF